MNILDTLSDSSIDKHAIDQYPGEFERPCYRVYDDWVELDHKKLKPGVYHHTVSTQKPKNQNSVIILNDFWICGPLIVDSYAIDNNKQHFRLLKFQQFQGVWRYWIMPMSLLRKPHGEDLRGRLLDLGLQINIDEKGHLARYINSCHPTKSLNILSQPGWQNNNFSVFVLPDMTFMSNRHTDSTQFYYQSDSDSDKNLYCQRGTLTDWQQNISRYCIDNPLLTLAVCSAFAGPLLRPVSQQGGGFHIFGDSSMGKSTALSVASSVWGNDRFNKSWRGTANGLEATGVQHNDSLLPLDEISQCDPREIGQLVYSLANGFGKQRANKLGLARTTSEWRVMILSNGERSIDDVIALGGKKSQAGQEIRLLNIPLFGQYGSFNCLHDKKTGCELSNHLKFASTQFYGVAGVEFLKQLINENRDLNYLFNDFLATMTINQQLSAQQNRAVQRFALLALAGELATEYGITSWKTGDAEKSIFNCFIIWQKYFGSGNIEDNQILESIRDFIDRYGDSRFSEIHDNRIVHERAGYWKDDNNQRLYLFNKSGLSEALQRNGLNRGIKTLKKHGWLICKNQRNTIQQRIRGDRLRFYCVKIPDDPVIDRQFLQDVV